MTWRKMCTLLSVSLWWCHWNRFQLNEAAVSRENFKKVSWKAKKPEAEEFPLQQGQSSEFKHWKGWLRGDLHDESLQRNLNRNIRSGLWTCRELDWYVQNPRVVLKCSPLQQKQTRAEAKTPPASVTFPPLSQLHDCDYFYNSLFSIRSSLKLKLGVWLLWLTGRCC